MATSPAEQMMGLWSDETPDPDMSSWREYLLGPRSTGDQVKHRLKILDLFSGVGGLALGFIRAAEEQSLSVDSVGAADTDEGALWVYGQNLEAQALVSSPVPSLVDFQVRGWGD